MKYFKLATLPEGSIELSDIQVAGRLSARRFEYYTGNVAIEYDDGRLVVCHMERGELNGPYAEYAGLGKGKHEEVASKKGFYHYGLPDGRWAFSVPVKETPLPLAVRNVLEGARIKVFVGFRDGQVVTTPQMTLYWKEEKVSWACEGCCQGCPSRCSHVVTKHKATAKNFINEGAQKTRE